MPRRFRRVASMAVCRSAGRRLEPDSTSSTHHCTVAVQVLGNVVVGTVGCLDAGAKLPPTKFSRGPKSHVGSINVFPAEACMFHHVLFAAAEEKGRNYV